MRLSEVQPHIEEKKNSKAWTKTNGSSEIIDKDTVITHHGETLGTLEDITHLVGERCDCPVHNPGHGDSMGEDYGLIVQLSGGDVGVHCSGSHCKKTYIPDTAKEVTKETKLTDPVSLGVKDFFGLSDTPVKTISLGGIPYPEKGLTMLGGDGGVGKSFITIKLAIGYLEEYKSSKVLFWFTEDYEAIIRKRIELFTSDKDILSRMDFVTNTDTWGQIPQLTKLSKNYGLTILDPLISFYEGEENNNGEARQFMLSLQKLNGLIIVIHHSSKGGSVLRGASDFRNGVRMVYKVEKPLVLHKKGTRVMRSDDKDLLGYRCLFIDKDNWGVANTVQPEVYSDEHSGFMMKVFEATEEEATRVDERIKTIQVALEEVNGKAISEEHTVHTSKGFDEIKKGDGFRDKLTKKDKDVKHTTLK